MPDTAPKPLPKRRNLRKEITWVLVLKIMIIIIAGFTLFGAKNRLFIDKDVMTNHLLGSNSSPSIPPTR